MSNALRHKKFPDVRVVNLAKGIMRSIQIELLSIYLATGREEEGPRYPLTATTDQYTVQPAAWKKGRMERYLRKWRVCQ